MIKIIIFLLILCSCEQTTSTQGNPIDTLPDFRNNIRDTVTFEEPHHWYALKFKGEDVYTMCYYLTKDGVDSIYCVNVTDCRSEAEYEEIPYHGEF